MAALYCAARRGSKHCRAGVCSDHLFHLNFAITLYNNDDFGRAKTQFAEFEKLFEELDEEARSADPEVLEQKTALSAALSVVA